MVVSRVGHVVVREGHVGVEVHVEGHIPLVLRVVVLQVPSCSWDAACGMVVGSLLIKLKRMLINKT
jgi:hypothetical protein